MLGTVVGRKEAPQRGYEFFSPVGQHYSVGSNGLAVRSLRITSSINVVSQGCAHTFFPMCKMPDLLLTKSLVTELGQNPLNSSISCLWWKKLSGLLPWLPVCHSASLQFFSHLCYFLGSDHRTSSPLPLWRDYSIQCYPGREKWCLNPLPLTNLLFKWAP